MPRGSSTRTTPRKDVDQRFVFLDLDSLLCAVRSHVLTHENQFHKELASFSSDVALCPNNLTVLLNGQHPSRVQCWRGTYCNPNAAEAKALEGVRSDGGTKIDWKLTQKGTPQHPTLEKMLKRHLTTTNGAKKTLVLATGVLTKGLKSCVDAYLKAQWRVQLVTLDSCYKKSDWHFTELDGFDVKIMDKYLKKLLTAKHCETLNFERKALYQLVAGASSGYDVRLNFRALTERVCGSKTSLVKRRLASYRKMPRELALPLQEFDWEIHALSQSSSGNKGLYYVLLDLLETAGAAKHKNTLVLVMGDGALGGSGVEQKEATKDLLTKFLDKNWFVEIHSWLHALNDWFLDIQEQYQYRVAVKPLDDAIHDLVYLKQDEEDVWVEPVWPGSHRVADPALASSPVPQSPPQSAWGTTAIPTLSLFPTTPLLTMEQKLEQK
ncbi:hypothetical protein PI124_g10229 [Phytophthora idaei]|nr:hypothetical protein PI124_g10229 [Phytophthora idaei]